MKMICIWSSWCHCHPIISCCSKIQNCLPFWCWLSQVVLEKRLLNGCSSWYCYIPILPWASLIWDRVYLDGGMACLDHLLIVIRSFTLLCDQSRSQARLIAIMKLIAKLGIIYTTACHASLCTSALDCLSVSCHCRRTVLTTIYKHGKGRGGGD